MSRSVRLSPFGIAFLIWFALSVGVGRYIGGFAFYRSLFGELAEVTLALTTLLVAVALVTVRFLHPREPGSARGSYALLCIGLLALVEVGWRLGKDEVHWDTTKVLGSLLDVSTPAFLALGFAAVVSEWRRPSLRTDNGSDH